MKKMLICIPSLITGGAEKSLYNFINHYKNKFEISLLVYSERNNHYGNIIKDIKIDYFIKKEWPFFFEKNIGRIFRILPAKLIYKIVKKTSIFKRERYDIEFSYLESISTKIIAGSDNKHSKKVAYIHCDFSTHWYSRKSYLNYFEEYKCYKKFDNILAVSSEQVQPFINRFPGMEVSVIPNIINEDEILLKAEEPLEVHNTPYFCAVGRLEEVKNYKLLIDAFYEFHKNYSNYNLMILGEGKLFEELNNYISELRADKYIYLVGFKENPYKYIKNSVGLIQSSHSESFSYVLAEAAILGIPSVSTITQGSKFMSKYFTVKEVEHNKEALIEGIKEIVNEKIDYVTFKLNKDIESKFNEIFNIE